MSEGITSVLSALGFLNPGLHLMQTLFILKLEQSSQLLRILLITTTLASLALGHSILATTAIIQHQHVDALLADSQEVMDLISALPMDVVALSTMTEVMDDPDMHE